MENLFVSLAYEPNVWRALQIALNDSGPAVIKLETGDGQSIPPHALIRCRRVELAASGLLRLEFSQEGRTQPPVLAAVSVPSNLVMFVAESSSPKSIGFV